MKLIFLAGMGQSPQAWDQVRAGLPDYKTEAVALTSPQGERSIYQGMRQDLLWRLQAETEDFVLIGLSLGGMLALDLAGEQLPHLKGLVLSGTQYKLEKNKFFALQIAIMKLVPKFFFAHSSLDKKSMIALQEELRHFNLEASLARIALPSLIICGDKDKFNLQSARFLAEYLRKAELVIISGAGHVINTEKPEVLAAEIAQFLEKNYEKT